MNPNKTILRAFSLSCLLLSSSILPMMQWFKDKQKHDAVLKKIQSLTTVSAVDDEINLIKSTIYKEGLIELNHITEIPYETLKKQFDGERILIKEALQKDNPLITQNHSNNIPPSMYNDLMKIIVEEKINPKNVILNYVATSPHYPGANATSRGGLLDFYPDRLIRPDIMINQPLTQKSKAYQHFVYRHELNHIFLRHGSMDRIAMPYNANKKRFISITEREADIHAASSNIHAARAGKEASCSIGHEHIINQQSHCHDMQIMYALIQQKERLS